MFSVGIVGLFKTVGWPFAGLGGGGKYGINNVGSATVAGFVGVGTVGLVGLGINNVGSVIVGFTGADVGITGDGVGGGVGGCSGT